MTHKNALPIVENLLHKFVYWLMDSDETVTGLMTETNSFDWDLSDTKDLKAWFKGKGLIDFSATLKLCGDPHEEKPFSGSEISFDVEGAAAMPQSSSEWKIQSYKIRKAKITDF